MTDILKDPDAKTLTVVRELNAPKEAVWRAWTQKEYLEKWWAPKPWKAVTKDFAFREGGRWLYYMSGPKGEKSWAYVKYKAIVPTDRFDADDGFCDENGTPNTSLPTMHWAVDFSAVDSGTRLTVVTTFASVEDMEKLTRMGMIEGFTQALDQLDILVSAKAE